jgi:hypothetical protein
MLLTGIRAQDIIKIWQESHIHNCNFRSYLFKRQQSWHPEHGSDIRTIYYGIPNSYPNFEKNKNVWK